MMAFPGHLLARYTTCETAFTREKNVIRALLEDNDDKGWMSLLDSKPYNIQGYIRCYNTLIEQYVDSYLFYVASEACVCHGVLMDGIAVVSFAF